MTFKGVALRAYLLDAWKSYLKHEVAYLTFEWLDLAEQITRAVLFQNTSEGYAAEGQILLMLDKRYGPLFKADRDAFRRIAAATCDDQGFIYVMVSPALKENFLKIGKTSRTPQERAEEISVGTGVPLRFYVVYQVLVSDCHEVERVVHAKLAQHRSNVYREFFEVPLHHAVEVIGSVARQYPPSKQS